MITYIGSEFRSRSIGLRRYGRPPSKQRNAPLHCAKTNGAFRGQNLLFLSRNKLKTAESKQSDTLRGCVELIFPRVRRRHLLDRIRACPEDNRVGGETDHFASYPMQIFSWDEARVKSAQTLAVTGHSSRLPFSKSPANRQVRQYIGACPRLATGIAEKG